MIDVGTVRVGALSSVPVASRHRTLRRVVQWLAAVLVAVAVIAAGTEETRADEFTSYYYAPPSFYVVPPIPYYPSIYGAPEPNVVYYPQGIVEYPAVVPYYAVPQVTLRTTERYRVRRRSSEYEYKVYSPYRLGPVYRYKVEFERDGDIEVRERFR